MQPYDGSPTGSDADDDSLLGTCQRTNPFHTQKSGLLRGRLHGCDRSPLFVID